ncbi:MAG: hypothetical protein Q8M40_02705 [Legionella sp.]|nr:hypothetical protein [Legionella sp.]
MTIESAILYRYQKMVKSNEPDIDLLFDVISVYIKEMNWIYEGNACHQVIHQLEEQENLKVNCFMLTSLFVHLSILIGICPDACFEVTIPNFVSTKDNPNVQGDYQPFNSTLSSNSDGFYEFDIHCIAMINSSCYDLLLQAKYPLVNDGADIYWSLSIAMSNDNLDHFRLLVPYLLNINEQCPSTGWTLLHEALNEGKFDFAIELLKNGAQDNILDNNLVTPFNILNDQLYNSSVSLETLIKAKKYQDLKIELIIKNRKEQFEIKNKAPKTTHDSFWRNRQYTSNPSLTPEPETEQNINP